MNILMLSYEFPPIGGGGAKVVHGLAGELAAGGLAVDLVTMGFRGLAREEEAGGLRVHRVPCLRRNEYHCTAPEAATYAMSAFPAALRLTAARRPDLVHAHFIFPDGFLAWAIRRRTGVPYLITAHGSDVPGYNPHRLKVAHRLLAPLWSTVTRSAARIVCPSESLRTLVTRRGRGDKTVVVPNGVDPGRFDPGRPKSGRILVVTRMLERKGVQHILAALERFPRTFEIDIVGDGPFLPGLRRMAREMGVDARFTGWLDSGSPQFRELFETSGIFVLPSSAENFPNVLLEAMTAGMAIVTTKGTGCAEVVGDAALLVPPLDPPAIRGALLALLDNPTLRGELGKAARGRMEKFFGWRAVAGRYAQIYGEIRAPNREQAGGAG